jgi:DNA helicase-2/ATP-dependent DNA helicase PcrA
MKIEKFRSVLDTFRTILTEHTVSEAIKHIIVESGMEKLYSTGIEEDTDRLENIMELVTLARKYDALPKPEGLEQFLTDSSLASDQDTLDTPQNGIKLMTVHASKGLEFNTVFISGLESDLFPHKGMGGQRKSSEDMEEERRLFYVALTRAEKKLFLTYARTRTIFGNMEVNAPSEFLSDIPDEYTEHESYTSPEPFSRKPLFSIDF